MRSFGGTLEVSLQVMKPGNGNGTGPLVGGDSKESAGEILSVDQIGIGVGWGSHCWLSC